MCMVLRIWGRKKYPQQIDWYLSHVLLILSWLSLS